MTEDTKTYYTLTLDNYTGTSVPGDNWEEVQTTGSWEVKFKGSMKELYDFRMSAGTTNNNNTSYTLNNKTHVIINDLLPLTDYMDCGKTITLGDTEYILEGFDATCISGKYGECNITLCLKQ
jgi:hypothetical protein